MRKPEFIRYVAKRSGIPIYRFQASLEAFMDAIISLYEEGEPLDLKGFGHFELKDRAARKGRNVSTGEMVDIPPRKIPFFRPGKLIYDAAERHQKNT